MNDLFCKINRIQRIAFFSLLFLLYCLSGLNAQQITCNEKSTRDLTTVQDIAAFHPDLFNTYWTVEGQEYEIRFWGDTIEIEVKEGFTMWRNKKYSGHIEINYKACVMDEGQPNDRLSDLNCFWMAQDPLYPGDLFKRQEWRAGIFDHYYTLKQYYMGYGGNYNTTTRFRKYDGDFEAFRANKTRPAILTEYTDKEHLLKPNHWYDIRIVCEGKQIKYYTDGELIVDYTDEAPYTSGYFGFRTTKARVRVTEFNVKQF
ncbi:MAG: DUF1080 domain-containing protein [Tannerella sp.]|jgi:rhamnogalacturonan endolyase|nr:DUF1080 domain-containing protein [Tannerella sp.]